MAIFDYSKHDMTDLFMIIDGKGQPWHQVVYVDTVEGSIEFVRVDQRTGKPLLMLNPPVAAAGHPVAVTTKAKVPTPISIVFASEREKNLLRQGQRPYTLFDQWYFWRQLLDDSRKREPWEQDVGSVGVHGVGDVVDTHPQLDSSDNTDDENKVERFVCPCCGAPMREAYTTKRNWYLICTQCTAQVIK